MGVDVGRTVDERFLIKMYETAQEKKAWDAEVEIYSVGRAVGLKDKAIKIIVRELCQSNFIRKSDDLHVYLTENGLKLVRQLIH